MKVVLFCGGQGMRLQENAASLPKPMVTLGNRPLIWHVMKYYAHFGHQDFILCLGHRSDILKNYFLHYDECLSNDFILSDGARKIELLRRDIDSWRITFVDTGIDANIGQRLMAVRQHLRGERTFLANYSDGLTDLHLPDQIAHFEKSGKVASFLSVRPNLTCHFVNTKPDGCVESLHDAARHDIRINGGFFVFRSEIFDYMREGEELVREPFQRLIEAGELVAYRYDGFWMAMDTFKDKHQLEDRYVHGTVPWEIWRKARSRTEGKGGGRRVSGNARLARNGAATRALPRRTR